MSANVDAMVREGVNAFKTGRKDEARALLLKATELDQYNEQAWLWLSGLMESVDDQRTCLENVLAINPDNERAKQGLAYLTGQTSAGQVSPFSASTPPPPSSSFSSPPPTPPSSAPTSVEWALPDESASPSWNPPPAAEPSEAVLDDWVSNLNLPANSGEAAAPFGGSLSESSSASPFGDYDLDDDFFTDGPFGAADDDDDAPEPAPTPTRRANLPDAPRQSPGRESERQAVLEPDDDELLESEESELFGYIPREIVPTRLPGTHERTPILLTLIIILLIVFNIGAASMFMFSLLA